MRDYALHQSASFDNQMGAGILAQLIRNWRAHRAVARLELLDDNMLRDIGIEREEVLWASRLSLSENAAIALQERAAKRRRQSNPFD
jgi:uncharacterized protein YjiS (DUF1127 family)